MNTVVPFPRANPRIAPLERLPAFWIGRARYRLDEAERAFRAGDRRQGSLHLDHAMKFIGVAQHLAAGGIVTTTGRID